MSSGTLKTGLNRFPRLLLAAYPTPLEPLPRLSQALGGPSLWIKRDDGIGPGMGGNKGRKLEFIMADVLRKGRQKVVTYGGLQSNHCRMTAAACVALGLEAHLFFFERRPDKLTGNLLLNRLFDANMHFIPFGGGGSASRTLETTDKLVRLVAAVLVSPRAYFIPVGGRSIAGCLGYVAGALELHEQVAALGLEKVTVVTAVGSGGTLAGLMAGFSLLDSPIKLLGIDVGKLWRAFPASIAKLAGQLCAALGQPHTFRAEDVPLIEDRYVGPGYAVLTTESVQAIRSLARREGIILDPVYTGKAFAGLLDGVENGRFAPDETVIFLHTGGLPGL